MDDSGDDDESSDEEEESEEEDEELSKGATKDAKKTLKALKKHLENAQQILTSRRQQGKTQYLVKFRGETLNCALWHAREMYYTIVWCNIPACIWHRHGARCLCQMIAGSSRGRA